MGWFWGIMFAAIWFGAIALARWIGGVRPRGDDVLASASVRLMQVYSRLVHRLRIEGQVPQRPEGRPAIVVANHTAGVDPVLVQAALPFEARWMMARDMRIPALDSLWKYGRVIFVDRVSPSSGGLREALRHLKGGGVLGVFPEGHIERPPRHILPFREGIGLLIRKTDALVLPVVIEGTPRVDPAWASLRCPSRSTVRFLEPVDYTESGMDAGEIAADLRRRYLEATGWPALDEPPRQVDGRWIAARDADD